MGVLFGMDSVGFGEFSDFVGATLDEDACGLAFDGVAFTCETDEPSVEGGTGLGTFPAFDCESCVAEDSLLFGLDLGVATDWTVGCWLRTEVTIAESDFDNSSIEVETLEFPWGMRKDPSQFGHLPRLPAWKSLTCRE